MTVKRRPKPAADDSVQHSAAITVTENKPHRMYLRRALANGETEDGRTIEVSQTNVSIVIQVGKFADEHGRQFTIGITDLVAGVLKGMGIK